MTPHRQGELIGNIIGRYGVDLLLFAGTVKGIKAFRALKEANAALTLEVMSKQLGNAEKLAEISHQWWLKNAPIVEEIKLQQGRIGANLYKKFNNSYLSELQIRRILHHAGIPTFPRPKGISHGYKVSLSEKHGGMIYTHPSNPDFYVRVSPGIPNSPHPAHKNPYVIHKTDRGFLDKNGMIYERPCAETHIPLHEYDFERLSKIVPEP